jgi:hypothetical protein
MALLIAFLHRRGKINRCWRGMSVDLRFAAKRPGSWTLNMRYMQSRKWTLWLLDARSSTAPSAVNQTRG